jgi:hypothetical protein
MGFDIQGDSAARGGVVDVVGDGEHGRIVLEASAAMQGHAGVAFVACSRRDGVGFTDFVDARAGGSAQSELRTQFRRQALDAFKARGFCGERECAVVAMRTARFRRQTAQSASVEIAAETRISSRTVICIGDHGITPSSDWVLENV